MKLSTLAAAFAVAALLFFAFGCTASAPPAQPGGSNLTPTPAPPSDIPPPPPGDDAMPPSPGQNIPNGGDAPPPAPV